MRAKAMGSELSPPAPHGHRVLARQADRAAQTVHAGLLGCLVLLMPLLVLTLPGHSPSDSAAGGAPAADSRGADGLGGGARLRASQLGAPTPLEIRVAASRGLTLRSAVWSSPVLAGWTPFGPPLVSRWSNRFARQTSLEALISDDQFVWGPNVGDFDVGEFLEERGSRLAAYAGEVELWASYSSVNPQVLLAVLELRDGFVTSLPQSADPAAVRDRIEITALELATAFYEHLYTWGARAEASEPPPAAPSLALGDGTVVALEGASSSGTYALQQALAAGADAATWQALTAASEDEGFGSVFAELFPGVDPLAGDNPITPADVPPEALLQLPIPLGDAWRFWGAHSWNGDSTPPFSSLDFTGGSGTCSAPPGLYTVASAGGTSTRRSTCWMEINHGSGWVTSYYHLQNLVGGGSAMRNARLGSIACEVCAGGYATGPHVHWSLKYNGAYVSLEGVKLTGWTVHIGPTAYSSGSLERDGVFLTPGSSVLNDYHVYYPTYNTSLRFFGSGAVDGDRLKIPVDDPLNGYSGPPIDVGATDFTLEWWMKALPGDNDAGAVTCGANTNWVYGNTILDRDRLNQDRDYGVSLADGRVVVGFTGAGTGSLTLCTTSRIDDGLWHHVALVRNRWNGTSTPVLDGEVWVFIDGRLEAHAVGPGGDLSYPDTGAPLSLCGPSGTQSCAVSDPYLVLGARKSDVNPSLYPPFRGWIDELRVSNNLRYTADFTRPTSSFAADASTIALLLFNENAGASAYETSGADAGPSNGVVSLGGSPAGPEWSYDVPFSGSGPTPTPMPTPTPTPDPTLADINQDGRVDVVDVQLAVNVFLGTETDPGIVARADVNRDGSVDVLDVQWVVNIILMG